MREEAKESTLIPEFWGFPSIFSEEGLPKVMYFKTAAYEISPSV